MALGDRQADDVRALDGLRVEFDELRASRKRLVLAADADRRGSSATCTRACSSTWSHSPSTSSARRDRWTRIPRRRRRCSSEMGHDVQQAMDEAGELAQRIYAPLLEAGGLAAALRSAAAGRRSLPPSRSPAARRYPPEVAGTVYLCCLEALELAGAGARWRPARCDEDGAWPSSSSRTATSGGARPLARPRRGARRPAGDPARSPAAAPACSARCRSRDDASRSPPGRGSRP